MKRVAILFFVFSFIGISAVQAAQVDTIVTRSVVMEKDIKAVVILPSNYQEVDSIPVLYLLHGAGGNYANWLTRVPALKELADRYEMMVVCPDGHVDSWYWDSPENTSYRYETYIAEELTAWIDANYKSRKSKEGRAITGLSMGGHGALYLAIKHNENFGAAGSTAGGVDIRPFPNNWGIKQHLGPYAENQKRWEEHTVMGLLPQLSTAKLALYIDCGVEDFFFPVNEELHRQLLYLNIPHTYVTGPGKHDWVYWSKSIRQQMQFFYYYFYPEAS